MTPKQYAELLEYITKNNGWGNMYHCHKNGKPFFKYIDACFDTRDGHIWKICFRVLATETVKEFRIDSEEDIKEIYEYLNGED